MTASPTCHIDMSPIARRVVPIILASLWFPLAQAGTLYRCSEANGKVTYSGKPCKETNNTGAERAIDYSVAPPRSLAPTLKRLAPVEASATRQRRSAVIRLFYDPANAPVEHSLAQMETLIRKAVALWSEGCAVELDYGGTAPYVVPGSPERVSIRWSGELMYARHPANDAAGIAGVGSLRDGISLRPRVGDDELPRIVVHEIGHVLGISHLHEDAWSVMSYMPNKASQLSVQPSAADFLACNRAMRQRFGVDIRLPDEQPGRRMNDREAIDRKMKAPVSQ